MHFEFDIIVKDDNETYNVVGDATVYRDYVNADPEGNHGQWEWSIDTLHYSVFDEDDNDVTDLDLSLEYIIEDRIFKLIEEDNYAV